VALIVAIGVAAAEATTVGGLVVQDVAAQLNDVDLNGTATLSPIGGPAAIEYNNMGYRPTDAYLYAVQLNGTGLTGGNNGIVRVDPITGAVAANLGVPLGLGGGADPLPTGAGSRFDAGDVTPDGATMFISFGYQLNTNPGAVPQAGKLYVLDLPLFLGNPLSDALDLVTITGDAGAVHDWAYNPLDGSLYGGDSTHGQLAKLNPVTGVRTDVAVAGLPSGVAFGASWWDASAGHLFAYRNDGSSSRIYEIDVLTNTLVDDWSAPGSTRNDGAYYVPEPATMGLLSLGGVALLRRRSQIRHGGK
jgi:hypothetical protein